MLLTDIKFPVFRIGSHKKIWEDGGILYILMDSDNILKIDNKNVVGDTIGKRRLKIPKKQRYKFAGTYLTLAQLVKDNKKLFVDNEGKLIKYKKQNVCKLTYHKILRAANHENVGYILTVRGILPKFKVSRAIYDGQEFIGLLRINKGYLLYELSEERKPDTWRKI